MKRNIKSDLKKLANAFFKNLEIDNCEFGGIGLNSKRPFGNSDVERDILDIIGWEMLEEGDGENHREFEEQYDYARKLYFEELIPYLKKTYGDNK